MVRVTDVLFGIGREIEREYYYWPIRRPGLIVELEFSRSLPWRNKNTPSFLLPGLWDRDRDLILPQGYTSNVSQKYPSLVSLILIRYLSWIRYHSRFQAGQTI